MFVQTEETPNENALKFIPGNIPIAKNKPYDFADVNAATGISKLAVKLFEIGDVARIFYGSNFITITKTDAGSWDVLKPHIFATIVEYMTNGWPIFDDEDKNIKSGETGGSCGSSAVEEKDFSNLDPELAEALKRGLDTENPIIKEILTLVDERVRPAVAMDGGDINVKAFVNGIVYVELLGACNGCSSSSATLKGGVETMLKYYIPEVKAVEPI